MAVPKSRKSRSKRGSKRNANSRATGSTLATDSKTGEIHLRHHMTTNGMYRNRAILNRVTEEAS